MERMRNHKRLSLATNWLCPVNILAQAVSIMFPQSPTKSHKAPLCRKKRHKSQTRRAFLNEFEKLFVILRRTIKLSCLIATKDVFLNRL